MKKTPEPTTQSAVGWLNAQTDPPKWYQPVTIKLKDKCILEGWARVTYHGDKEYYTSINPEINTLIDAKEVVEWEYLPGHRSTTN